MPNELDTHDDNWQDLLKLEDDKVTTLNDAYLDNVILNDWLDKSEDSIDYMRFKLNETAKICLTVNADKNLKYTLYRYANGVLETIQTGSLSKTEKIKLDDGSWEYPEWDFSATTKAHMLQPGEFFISVQAKDKTKDSNYDVELNGAKSAFFAGKDDHGDDKWQAIHEAAESDYDLGTIRKIEEGDALTDGWVGYGDNIAWRKFTLEKTARMRFNVHADDSSVFTLLRFNADTQALESVLTAKPKKPKKSSDELDYALTVRTDRKVLNPGEYYISMESTNADTGGSAEFRVDFDPDCLIFAKGNNEDDTPEAAANDETGVYRLTDPEIWDEWVGCGDEYDYRVFRLDHAARISFTINSSDQVKLTIFEFATNARGKEYRKQILSISPGKTQKHWDSEEEEWIYPEWKYSATNKNGKLFDKEKDYYICVQSMNAAKGGSADYSLEIWDSRDFTQSNDTGNDWSDLKEEGDASQEYYDAGMLVPGISRLLSGWVGYGDELDYSKIHLGSKAKLKFQINASEKVKFTIYRLTGIPGHYALKQVQTSTTAKTKIYRDEYGDLVEPDWAYSSKTAAKTLAAGDYYICVKNPDAAKGGDADYQVNFLSDDSKFYDTITYNRVYGPEQKTPDDGRNNWAYDSKQKMMNNELQSYTVVDGNTTEIVLDSLEISFEHNGKVFHNFVGQFDECDFTIIHLDSAAKLVFNVDSSDAALFSVYQCVQNKKGDYELKILQASSPLLNQTTNSFHVTTPALMLEGGDYYISMESQNASIGGSAYYNVTLNRTQSVFFTKADNSDDWSDMKTNGPSGMVGDVGVLDGTWGVLAEDWVGYGDEIDYYGFSLNTPAKLRFTIEATDEITLSVQSLTMKDGVYSLKTLQTTTVQRTKGAVFSAAITKALALKEGDYYLCVESTNASLGGSADYTVRLSEMSSFQVQDASALSMPETDPIADNLAITDSLCLDRYDADMLAGSFPDSASDKLSGESSWAQLA